MFLDKKGVRFKMIEVRPKGCINELNFGYNTKMEGCTNSSSNIPKLGEMLLGVKNQDEEQTISNLG